MGTTTHDYDKLEREYLASTISIRALCTKHGIKGYSAVAEYAREHGWYEKRDRIRSKIAERTIEKTAERLSEQEVDIITQFREESLTVIRAALYKFAEDLKDPNFRVRPDELVKLIGTGLLITGQPTSRVEERRFDLVANFEGLPTDILRRFVESTRPIALSSESDSARAGTPGSRQN